MLDRERAGREASPSGGVLDSQTVKAPFAETGGFDGGKKIVGRKRHIAVDTDGRLLMDKAARDSSLARSMRQLGQAELADIDVDVASLWISEFAPFGDLVGVRAAARCRGVQGYDADWSEPA